MLEGVNVFERGGEEKLHSNVVFVTFSSLVHEEICPIKLIKVARIENKN